MNIIQADRRDLSEIDSLIKREFSYTDGKMEPIEERFNDPDNFFLKAVEGAYILGFVEYKLLPDRAFLLGLAVHTSERGKGIGEALLNAAVQKIHEKKIRHIELYVRRENALAIKLYMNAGFKFRKRLPQKINNEIVDVMFLK
jgi:ribosomal protein S18 acetylase RimI-like enzyme